MTTRPVPPPPAPDPTPSPDHPDLTPYGPADRPARPTSRCDWRAATRVRR
jgi:hypothetical protein